MDNFLNIEVNKYGVCLDSAWTYLALSWQILATAVVITIGYRVYKKRFAKI